MISTSVSNSIPRASFARACEMRNQFQNVARRRIAVVHNEIAVLGGNHRPADARAFQSQLVNQFARRNRCRIFEHAAGARRGGLRFPALLAELLHAPLDFLARRRQALENRAQRNVIFSSGAAAIFHRHAAAAAFVDFAGMIHEPHRLDDIKGRTAHRARVHAQRAANAARNAFEKFHAAQTVPFRLDRNVFQLCPRAATQSVHRQLQCG